MVCFVLADRDLRPFSRVIRQTNSPQYDPQQALRSTYRPDVTDDGEEDNKSLSLKKRRKKRGQITANLSGTRYDIGTSCFYDSSF